MQELEPVPERVGCSWTFNAELEPVLVLDAYPQDRRAIRLGITETGRALIDEAFDTSLRVYESMVDGLGRNELKTLDALLEKLLLRLDELSGVRQPWNSVN